MLHKTEGHRKFVNASISYSNLQRSALELWGEWSLVVATKSCSGRSPTFSAVLRLLSLRLVWLSMQTKIRMLYKVGSRGFSMRIAICLASQ